MNPEVLRAVNKINGAANITSSERENALRAVENYPEPAIIVRLIQDLSWHRQNEAIDNLLGRKAS